MKHVNLLGVLRVAVGSVLIIEGIDKFYNNFAYWPDYTAPQVLDMLPIAHSEFLGILGITEVAVGAILLFRARLGGLLVAMLMFGIVINLILLGDYYNIALLNTIVALTCVHISHAASLKKPPVTPPPLSMQKKL